MRNLLILSRNTLKIIFRKKFNIVIYLILPVAVILFTMSLYKNDSGKVNVGIYNKDAQGIMAKDFIEGIKDQGRYKVKMLKGNDIKNYVAERKVDCVITIPENFEDSIYNHSFDKLEISSIKGEDATGFIQTYTNYYIKNLMDLSKTSNGNKAVFNELYAGFKNQTLKVQVSLVKDKSSDRVSTLYSIGFLVMFMMQGANNTSGIILREKREKTYNRIFSTPVNSKIYLGANILSNMCLMTIQATLVVFAAKYMFGLDTGVPNLQLIAILLTFGLVCVTLGILFVAFSENSSQAGYMSMLIITPTCMLSGCFWPIEYMPQFMQKISNFLPQTWALRSVSQMQDGKSFIGILPNLAVILAFAVALFLTGMYKMKINNSIKNFV